MPNKAKNRKYSVFWCRDWQEAQQKDKGGHRGSGCCTASKAAVFNGKLMRVRQRQDTARDKAVNTHFV
ncbi:hypothetical protein KCP73_20210 [Salmonella enterica subsp. enterica]|nr:hypothetical protein KCP73_20210 [Salmonella enterica subsp. enterica]